MGNNFKKINNINKNSYLLLKVIINIQNTNLTYLLLTPNRGRYIIFAHCSSNERAPGYGYYESNTVIDLHQKKPSFI